MDNPSQKLAAKIVERLIAENLVEAEVGKKLLPKLAEGRLKAEDWRLAVELKKQKETAS